MRPAARFRYHRPRRGPWLQLFDVPGWEWNSVELTIPDLPAELDGVRIVHISDLHLRNRWPKALEELMAKVQANPPDLLLFTGDLVDEKRDHIPALPLLRKFLAGVHAKHGSFATIGNHDGDLLAPLLGGMGVRLIMNERVEVSVRGATIELIGFPGPDRDDLDEKFVRSLPARRAGVPRIVVSHYPDLMRAASAAGVAPDLFLAGHTHGGQCCLPNEMPIIKHDSLPRHLCKGAHDYEGTCLIVTRGMGFTTLPIRIFCPGETIEIVLKSDTRL